MLFYSLVIKVKIDEIDKLDRPREKMVIKGPEALSEVELLAIMLGSGTKNESVLDLSKRLIKDYGIDRLFRMSYDELKRISGIKIAKATKLMATFEITRRILSSKTNDIVLNDAKDVYKYVRGEYSFLEYEKLMVILVNSKLLVIDKKIYTDKSYDSIDIKIKEIIKYAIEKNAFGIFLVHNHPSGNIYPSDNDILSTQKLNNMCKILNIHFFDHLIVSDSNYYSFCNTRELDEYDN